MYIGTVYIDSEESVAGKSIDEVEKNFNIRRKISDNVFEDYSGNIIVVEEFGD